MDKPRLLYFHVLHIVQGGRKQKDEMLYIQVLSDVTSKNMIMDFLN